MIDAMQDDNKYQYNTTTDTDSDGDSQWRVGVTGANRTRNRKQTCHSKSAILARENRARKKAHLEQLEQRCTKLYRDNKALRSTVRGQADRIKKIQHELGYYKTLLKHSDVISRVAEALAKASPKPRVQQNIPPPPTDDPILPALFPDEALSDDEWNSPTASPFAVEGYGVSHPPNADHTYTSMLSDEHDVGICLHVSDRGMSLEFCPRCSRKSSDDGFEEDDEDVDVKLF